MLSAVAVVAALAALLAFAPFASAASDPVASGTTRITLNKGVYKKLKKAGVKVQKLSPATVKKRKATLPVSGGSLDPLSGAGSIEHGGGIKFKHGKKTAKVNTIVLETATASLKAKVAGKTMKLASLKGYSFARNGFGVNLTIKSLKLTGKAAKQLNKKLGFTGKKKNKKGKRVPVAPLFKGKMNLGGASSETQPKTVTVIADGSKAELLTNEATVKKFVTPIGLGGLGVEIKTVAPAETQLTTNPFTPKLLFPIAGGTIAPDASGGIVQTSGAVTLHQVLGPGAETTMTLNAIYIDLGAKTATVEVNVQSTVDPKLNLGALGRSSIADLSLTGATIGSDPANRKVTVSNATATLQAVTAETLNSVFGSPLEAKKISYEKFAPGDGLGIFSFVAQTQ